MSYADCSQCEDIALHDFYDRPDVFRWGAPRFTRYRPANRRTRAGLNRYPHHVIGSGVVVFGWAYGVAWKR